MMRLEQSKPLSEAPVNGGRNYNGPKVAKFLVGQVPTCTNGVTMATLSPPETQGTRNRCEDAVYPQLNGKTAGTSVSAGH